jgi:hypothetical protein
MWKSSSAARKTISSSTFSVAETRQLPRSPTPIGANTARLGCPRRCSRASLLSPARSRACNPTPRGCASSSGRPGGLRARLSVRGPPSCDQVLDTETLAPRRPVGYRNLSGEALAAGRCAGDHRLDSGAAALASSRVARLSKARNYQSTV